MIHEKLKRHAMRQKASKKAVWRQFLTKRPSALTISLPLAYLPFSRVERHIRVSICRSSKQK